MHCSCLQPSSAPHHKDKVLGLWYADKENMRAGRHPFFKQDFIVDLGERGEEFVSYSEKRHHPPYVFPIADFFSKYGDGKKYYHRDSPKPWVHWYNDIGDLPDDPQLRAEAERAKASMKAGDL